LAFFWTETWSALGAVLFPASCVSCRNLALAHDPPLCGRCWDRLPRFASPLCSCGTPLPGSGGESCGRCRRGLSVIARGASLGPYEGVLRDCVISLKYRGRHRTARGLAARLFADHECRSVLADADGLVGVPLHRDRENERGFNQAHLIAQSLSIAATVPLAGTLVRVRDTPSQTTLDARARRRNVRGAFVVPRSASVAGSVLVLIDDVTTTGATVRECARTLLAAGAREVRAIVVARAE